MPVTSKFKNVLRTFKIWLGYDIRTFGGVLGKIYEILGFGPFLGGVKKKFPDVPFSVVGLGIDIWDFEKIDFLGHERFLAFSVP